MYVVHWRSTQYRPGERPTIRIEALLEMALASVHDRIWMARHLLTIIFLPFIHTSFPNLEIPLSLRLATGQVQLVTEREGSFKLPWYIFQMKQ